MSWWKPKLPPRLRLWPTLIELQRMARHPAAYAPTAEEVLTPEPVPWPTIQMVPDERRLMDAILDNPNADEPRLQFAEWVEARDPDRAAFIRQQLANPHLKAMREHPFAPWGARDVIFRRGFAEEMSLSGRSFVNLSDGLFAATPLREVRLVAVNFLMDELVRSRNLSKLDRLNLSGNQIGIEGVRHLVGCPFLTNLRELNLSRNGLDDHGVRLLLSAPWVHNLTELVATGNRLTPAGEAELRAEFGNRVLLS